MDKNLTISSRSALVAALAVAAVVIAYLLGTSGSTTATATPEPTQSGDARTLTMVGSGSAVVVPDQLGFDVSVHVTRDDLDQALAEASSTLDKVYAALADEGVLRKDVQTAGLSMNPVYDYHSYGPPTLRGYQVTQRATVLVRDLKDGGQAVAAAVDAGGNAVRVNDLKLKVGDPDAAMKSARDEAVAAATEKAKQYAEATGQSLGAVLTLREVSNRAPSSPTVYRRAGYAANLDSAAMIPIRAGRDTTSVKVQVVWEFGQ